MWKYFPDIQSYIMENFTSIYTVGRIDGLHENVMVRNYDNCVS